MNIQKSLWSNGEHKVNLSFPIAKVNKEKRTVSGFATLDNLDRHGDIVLADASKRAFERFRGNLREMHQPIAVGKVLSFEEQDFYDAQESINRKGIYVNAYISKGAQDTWEKVLDGTLTGFSIGGNIVEASMEPGEEEADEERRVIKEYDLHELSLVDSPANPLANIFSIQKNGDELIFKGMATEVETENVFWCEADQIATSSTDSERDCGICSTAMETIGWVEKADIEKSDSIKKVVDGYFKKDDAPAAGHGPNGTLDSPSAPMNVIDSEETINLYPDQVGNNIATTKAAVGVGSFVTWGSSGGKAYGKITRVKTNGKIKVPDSSFEITGTTEDPAALIRIYEKTDEGWKPTDRLVGHKLSTLKPAKGTKKKLKISKGGDIVEENENLEELVEDQAETIEEVVEDSDEDTSVEKAIDVSEVEVDELDFTKMVTDLKDFVGEKLEKNLNKARKSTDEIQKAVDARFEAVAAENTELKKSIDELKEIVVSLQKSLSDTAATVAAVESDTAIKKSGEVDKPDTTIRKSNDFWRGSFLSSDNL